MKPDKLPDKDSVYSWLHYRNWSKRKKRPGSSAFKFDEDGMSCYWSKKISAAKVREISNKPEENGVLRFHVGKIRRKKQIDVKHTPHLGKPESNNSHSSIDYEPPVTKTEAITHLRDIYRITIAPPNVNIPKDRID